ncbi:MAG: T9SS type A sorting domain-containing protein [Bacteroidota bacterium]
MRLCTALLFCGLLLPVYASVVHAQDCDHFLNVTDGADTNDGSQAQPLRSLEFAFEALPDGARVCVAAGEYYLGQDGDGIRLAAAKSMTFVLVPFALNTEVRFSEGAFVLDVGSETIAFEAPALPMGTATLALGEGITNTPEASPDATTFLHSLVLRSGTLDFGNVATTIEASVGNPAYVRGSTAAPDTAAVVLAEGQITGTPTIREAPRTFRYAPGATQLGVGQLAPDATSAFLFDTAGDFTLGTPLALTTGRIEVRSGTVQFLDAVRVTAPAVPAPPVLSTRDDASLLLDGGLQVGGSATAPLPLLSHASSGAVSIAQLSLDTGARLTTSGDGPLVLPTITTDTPLSSAVLDHQGSGALRLGTAAAPLTFRGALLNAGTVQLEGPVALLSDATAPLALDNRGLLDLGVHDLTLSDATAQYRNISTISSTSGALRLTGDLSLLGGGALPRTVVAAPDVLLEAGSYAALSVVESGGATLNAPSPIAVAGSLTLNTSGTLAWTGTPTLRIGGEAQLQSGTLALADAQSLNLGGDLTVLDGTIAASATSEVNFAAGEHTLAAPSGFALPAALPLNGATLNLDGALTLEGPTTLGDGRLVLLPEALLTLAAPLTGAGAVDASAGDVRITAGTQRVAPTTLTARTLTIDVPDAEAVQLGGTVTSLGQLRMEAGQLQAAPDLQLVLQGDLTRRDGAFDVPPATVLAFSGTQLQQIVGFAETPLPSLQIQGDVQTASSLTVAGSMEMVSGTFSLTTDDMLTLDGAVSGSSDAAITAPAGTVRLTGTDQRLAGPSVEAAAVRVAGTPTVATELATTDLELQSGTLTLAPTARITLSGGLQATGGVLASAPAAVLRFASEAARTVAVPASWTFPTVRLEDGTLDWSTDAPILGNLDVTGGTLNLSDTALPLHGSLLQTGGTLNSAAAILILQSTDPVQLASNQPLDVARLLAPDGEGAVDVQAAQLNIGDQLAIGSGRMLQFGDTAVRLTGGTVTPILRNNGQFTGGVAFTGPATPGAQHSLDGRGLFGDVTVNLSSDLDAVQLAPGAIPRLAGQLTFQVGSLDLNGQPFLLEATNDNRPHLTRNLSDAVGTGGRADGGWFIDAAGGGAFNPDGAVYDLTYTGALTQSFQVDEVAHPSQVHHLTAEAIDALNTPARAGVVFSRDVEVLGNLTVAAGSVVQLDGRQLRLSGLDADHRLEGAVTSGTVASTGSGTLRTTAQLATPLIDTLVVNTEGTLMLDGLRRVRSIQLVRGALAVDARATATQISQLRVADGQLTVDGVLEIARGGQMAMTAGLLDMGSTGTVALLDGAALALDDQATVETSVSAADVAQALAAARRDTLAAPPATSEAGTIVFRGSGQVQAASPIPHLKLDPDLSSSAADDLFLSGDVTVSRSFVMVNGDVILGTSTLTHDGTLWAYDTDGTGSDDALGDLIQGATSQQGGTVKLTGPVEVQLGSDLNFFRAMLAIDVAEERGQVRFTSATAAPPLVRLFDEPFIVTQGTADFGPHDVLLESNIPDAFQIGNGRVVHDAAPRFPTVPGKAFRDDNAFPFRDDAYGEVVLSGGDATTLRLSGEGTVHHLRLNGPVALTRPDDTAALTLVGRLAFGEQGHDIMLPEGSLRFEQGCVVLRRGPGRLSTAPRFSGPVDVAYDLDDGDLTGTNRRFTDGTLPSGFEVPPRAVGIRSLIVLAGDAFGSPNTVAITDPLSVQDRVVVYGGRLSLSDTLTFADDADLVLMGLDADAAPQLTTAASAPYQTTGSLDFYAGSPIHGITSTDSLWPEDAAIDTLHVDLGQQDPLSTAGFSLHAPRTVGRLLIENDHPDAGLNLAGHALSVTGAATLASGTVSSGALATLQVGDALYTAPNSRLLGGLNVETTGDITIDGDALNSSLQSRADIRLAGNVGRNLSLAFTGTAQTLALDSGSQEISSLRLNQAAGDDGTPPRLRIASAQASPVSLRLNGDLLLEGGIVDTDQHQLVLAGRGDGFQRADGTALPRHVRGTLVRVLTAGHATAVTFPLGDAMTYAPLAFAPDRPLPAATDVTATHVDATPIGVNGLPISSGRGASLITLRPFHWTLRSATDMGGDMRYDVEVATPSSMPNASSARLLRRRAERMDTPWSALAGRASNTDQLLRLGGTDQLLSATPWVLGVATPTTTPDGEASLQVVHNDPTLENGQLDVYINGQLLHDNLAFRQGSDRIRLRLDGITTTAFDLALAPPSSQSAAEAFHTEAVTLTNNRHHVSVALGMDDAAQWRTFETRPPTAPSQVAVTFLHGAPDVSPGTLVDFFGSAPLATGWAFGDALRVSDFEPTQQVVGVLDPASQEQYVASTLNLDGLGGQSVTALLAGFAMPPPAAATSRALTVSLILPDGSLRLGNIVTGVEPEAADEVPARFELHGNYPNPFNPSTAIPFSLPEAAEVTLDVFDILGRRVLDQPNTLYAPGRHAITVDASAWASGTYIYRIRATSAGTTQQASGRMMLVK